MIDFTLDRSCLATMLRLDPARYKEDSDALLTYVAHARAAVSHNITLLHNVKRWPAGRDKDHNLRILRDNINGWRSKARNAVQAYRARTDVLCAVAEAAGV